MVTCYLRYILDPAKLKESEIYGKRWIALVDKFGGRHRGYFMPSEGASNVALALFTFPSLAAYETYRTQAASDPECKAVGISGQTQRLSVVNMRVRIAILGKLDPVIPLGHRDVRASYYPRNPRESRSSAAPGACHRASD